MYIFSGSASASFSPMRSTSKLSTSTSLPVAQQRRESLGAEARDIVEERADPTRSLQSEQAPGRPGTCGSARRRTAPGLLPSISASVEPLRRTQDKGHGSVCGHVD
jgi:hypothetical protein